MITSSLINDIQRSINTIERDNYVFLFGQFEKRLGLEPVFEIDELKNIKPKQPEVFGIYLIRNICRGCFLSINHILGGKILLKNNLYSPCLLTIYTGAFHLLNSLLARNGKVVEPLLTSKNNEIINKGNLVQANYSNSDNKWSYNKLSRDHKKKWRLLNDLYRTKKHPDYFEPLFKYWFGNLTKEDISATEYLLRIIKGEKLERYSFNEKFNDFLDHFVEFRHIASYNSFGSDIFFYDYVINSKPGDFIPDKFNNHCRMYLEFTHEMLKDSINNIKYLLNNIRMKMKYRQFLWWSINQPYFDEPKFEFMDNELKKDIKDIANWFQSSRQRKI